MQPKRTTALTPFDPLQVLAEASASLLEVPAVSSVVARIIELASNVIRADAYAFWRADGQDLWTILAAKGLSAEYMAKNLPGGGRSELTEPLIADDVQSHPALQARQDVYRKEGIGSLLTVPLLIANGPKGTITFYWKSQHKSTSEDVRYASTLANLAAAALNTAELYEQKAIQETRARFIAQASTILASALNYETTLKQVAELAVPTIADWCSVRIREGQRIIRTAGRLPKNIPGYTPMICAKIEDSAGFWLRANRNSTRSSLMRCWSKVLATKNS